MIDSMSYDASHISTLENLFVIRNSPSMYVGECAVPGIVHLINEAFDNGNDEHELLGHEIPLEMLFCFKKNTVQAVIIDRGRGIPIYNPDDVEDQVLKRVTGKLHTSGKFSIDGPYEAPRGTYGLGLKAITALSKDCCIITCNKNHIGFIQYQEGVEVAYEICENVNNHPTGTIIILEPDPKMFMNIELFEKDGIPIVIDHAQFVSIFSSRPIKIVIDRYDDFININNFYKNITSNLEKGFNFVNTIKRRKRLFEQTENIDIETYVRTKFEVTSPTIWKLPNITKGFDGGRLSYDIKLFLTENRRVNKGGIAATVNTLKINDPSSHHISAVSECLKEKIAAYIDDLSVRDYFTTLYKLPIYTIIRVQFKGAKFLDQTKKGFKDPVFLNMYKSFLMREFDSIPADVWEELSEYLMSDIEQKYKNNYNKNLTSTKGLKNIGLHLKNKNVYKACISKDKEKCELYIVEGQSAFNCASQACNNYYQAIFAQQGKPINGIRKEDKFLDDKFIRDLTMILGITSKDTSLENMNFGKIFILSDADDHGLHIATLILGNIFKINPLILSEGRVHLSNPPLYSLTMTNQMVYLKDYNALMEAKIESLYRPTFQIHTSFKESDKLVLIKDNTFINMCHVVVNLFKIMESASKSIGIETEMIEAFLKNLSYEDGEYILNEEGVKFLLDAQSIIRTGDHLIISIYKTDITISWKKFIEECDKYLYRDYTRFKMRDINFFITTNYTKKYNKTPITITALATIMSKLDTYFGESEYFKGLGEMNPEQLKLTCFAEGSRSSVQIRSIGDLDAVYGMLDTDSKQRKALTGMID